MEKKIANVSIGMPVRNADAFLTEAIESLLSQSFSDFELIISDNASDDDTASICQKYAARDHRIKYLRQIKNIGPTNNFKAVLDIAEGEYFMWAAADDRWSVDFISETKKVLDESPDVGLVFCGIIKQNLISKTTERYMTGFTSSRLKWFRYLFRLVQCNSNLIYGLHRRRWLVKLPIKNYDFFDVHLSHWYELEYQVRVVPRYLFVTGTWGERKAYSLTGRKLDGKTFIREEKKLLYKHFSKPVARMLLTINYFVRKRESF